MAEATLGGAVQRSHPKACLWSNAGGTEVVIDIPSSIQEAQAHDYDSRILSSPAVEAPYTSVNLTRRKKKSLSSEKRDDYFELHTDLRMAVADALNSVHDNFGGNSFCHDRLISRASTVGPRKRSLSEAGGRVEVSQVPTANDIAKLLPLSISNEQTTGMDSRLPNARRSFSPSFATWQDRADFPIFTCPEGFYGWNRTSQPASLSLLADNDTILRFTAPGSSSFVVSSCEELQPFQTFVDGYQKDLGLSKCVFDLVLLDPPWPNDSADRNQAYRLSTYDGICDMLLNLPIPSRLADNGYVALWITNNHRLYDLLFQRVGLFELWGVKLVEEWIWVKTTRKGEPVVPLNGNHRKPYEILLIARTISSEKSANGPTNESQVRRRFIFGVTDLHSRKPCLKSLFEQALFKERADYRALEIFARYLVQGWTSWGNEPFKYNWEGCWCESSTADDGKSNYPNGL